MPQPRAKSHADVITIVRRVLADAVHATDEDRQLDELDQFSLELASQACATIIILDRRMKHCGALLPHQVDAYSSAVRVRDGCLRALKIRDPYRAPAN